MGILPKIRRPSVNGMAPPEGRVPWNKSQKAADEPRILTGKNHPMHGRRHSEETRKKMSENHWSRKGINPWNKGKNLVERIKKTCPICGNFFFVPPHKNGQKYCSIKCRNAIPWNKGRKCSQISEALKGRQTWNKGLTKEIDARIMAYAEKLKGIKKPSLMGDNNPPKKFEVVQKLRVLNLGKNNPMYGKKLSPKHKRRLIKASLERRRDSEFSKEWNRKISRALRNKPKSRGHKNSLKKARLRQIFPKKDTEIEIRMQKALRGKRISFEAHKPILNVCQADMFIRPNICVFCDGDWWHANPKFYDRGNLKSKVQIYNIKRDALHNQILQREGHIVLRFWEDEINNSIENCVERIIKTMQKPTFADEPHFEPKFPKGIDGIKPKIEVEGRKSA